MSPLEIREHRTALAIVALFMVFAFGAAGLVVFAGDEQASSASEHPYGDTGSGGTPGTDASFDCPRGEPEGFSLSDVEGSSLSEAEQWAEGEGMSVRPVVIDGEPQATTMDYREDRVNVQVESGVVTRYCGNY